MTTRREFLKGILKGGAAVAGAAAVAGVPKAVGDQENRTPEKGQEFHIWSGKATCLSCGHESELISNALAIYGGMERYEGKAEHKFLLKPVVRCPECRQRIRTYYGTDMSFVEQKGFEQA